MIAFTDTTGNKHCAVPRHMFTVRALSCIVVAKYRMILSIYFIQSYSTGIGSIVSETNVKEYVF